LEIGSAIEVDHVIEIAGSRALSQRSNLLGKQLLERIASHMGWRRQAV
jgi:hypothetical protein